MGIQTGLTQYECDRCGIKQIIDPKQAAEEKWSEKKFIRANQSDVNVVLCRYCSEDWLKLMAKADTIFDNFMDKK